MLRQILAITFKDLKILFNDRGGMLILFAMPAMFILVMSTALQGVFEIGSSDRPIEILVANSDTGNLAQETIAELETLDGLMVIQTDDTVPLDRQKIEDLITTGDYEVGVVFPADFTDLILESATTPDAAQPTVTFIADPTTSTQFLAPIRGTVQGFIERTAAYSQAPAQMKNGIEAGFESLAQDAPPEQAGMIKEIGTAFIDNFDIEQSSESKASSIVQFERVAPSDYKIEKFPTSVEQNVPGYTVFGIFFIVQVLAGSILQEKQDGTFRRLLVAPLPRPALLLGKLLPYYLVNLIQVTVMFAVGRIFFGMGLGHAPLGLLLVSLGVAAAATGMGLLVTALGKTPAQISGVSTMLAITLSAIGGMMVPTFVMPEFMQTLAKISPHYWALAGYQDVIVRGLGAGDVLPEVGILLGFTVVFFGFAVWKFEFE
ncbi:MAG: ABC transporter permease [Chloroflexota bacterium]|nr:ABC transporter permease [Chloroflexota bacterium]